MELRQYFSLLRKWLWLIVVCIVLAAGSAYLVSDRQPPTYQATTTILINQASTATQDASALLAGERLARTYAQLMTKGPVMDEVISSLGLDISAKDLAKKVTVSLVRDTQLISLKVINKDPVATREIANLIPLVFSEHNEQMQLTRYKSSKENLQTQLNAVDADILYAEMSLEALRAQSEPDQLEIGRLEAALLQYGTTYANLLSSYEEIRVAEAKTLDTVTVVEPAVLDSSPVGPKTTTNTMLAGVVGAMVAVGTAFLIEYLDDTIKTPEDVERTSHLPTLGAIVNFRRYKLENEEWPIAALHPKSAIAEGYRMLRTNLEFATMGMGQSGAVLLVTSAQPIEGKTTTLANLGVSLAQAGKKVLLVDTDLRRPALHRQFKLPNEVGLTSLLLEQEADLGHVIQPTNVDGLSVLTAGRLPANPAEVLSFPETTDLLNQLRPLADYVLLDSPPVLSMADASILAQKVDGVCMVVETGKTRTEVFRRAAATLESVKARLIGVALNKVVARPGGYYDYYYYSSRYSTDQDEPRKRKGRKKRPRSVFARLFRRAKRPSDDHADLRWEAEPALEDHTRAEAEITAPRKPSEAEILYAQGMAHYQRGEWAQAQENWQRLKEIDPSHPYVDALLRTEDASPERTRVQSDWPVSLSPSVDPRTQPVAPKQKPAARRRRSSVSPWGVAILVLVAVAVAVAGLMYYGVIPLPLPIGVSNVQRYLNQGRAFYISENYEDAIQSFEQVLEIDAGNADATLSLQQCKDYLRISELYSEATALVQEGDCVSAIGKLAMVVEVDPWYRDAGILLRNCQSSTDLDRLCEDAVAYHDAGLWREAAGVFEAIREKDATYREMEIKSNLFDCYLAEGRRRITDADNSLDIIQANASFENALSLFPDSAAAQGEKQLSRLYTDGHLAYSRSSWSEAIVALSSIYHTRADYAGGRCAELLCDSCMELGDAHRAEGRLQLALEQYRAILGIPQCEGDEAEAKEQEILLLLSQPTATPADS